MFDTENRGFQGLWVPAKVWLDKSLSVLEKAIIADILSFDKYYKSNSKMAVFFGLSERRIQQALQEMEDRNLIARVTVGTESGRTLGRVIKLSWAYHQKLYPRPFPEEENRDEENFVGGVKKISWEGRKKFHPIKNTYKNTEEDITTASNSSSHSNVIRGEEEEEKAGEKKYFQRPIYDEVAMYVTSKGYHVDADAFWNFYEEREWKASGKPIMDWRKCCDVWEIRNKYAEEIKTREDEIKRIKDISNTFQNALEYGGDFDFEKALKEGRINHGVQGNTGAADKRCDG